MNAAKHLSCRRDFLKATAAPTRGLSELALLSRPALDAHRGAHVREGNVAEGARSNV